MTLIQRIADLLDFGRRTPDPGEHTELTVYRQLERLADSRSVVEHDLAREQRLADHLQAEGRKAMARGSHDKARALSDRRDTVLIRVNELRAAHRALTEAITQRSAAVTAVRSREPVLDESHLLTAQSPLPGGAHQSEP